MVKLSTVKSWGFGETIGWELQEGTSEVCLIYCKLCREHYEEENKKLKEFGGAIKKIIDKYITGTKVVKKNNFQQHVKESTTHNTASLRISEKKLSHAEPTAESSSYSTSANNQTTLLPFIRRFTAQQRAQLTKKFQLAHFMASTGKSFSAYQNFASFEKTYHGVDIGDSYITDKAGAEIAKYIATSKLIKNITEPLNNVNNYYSVLMDGSSSAKILDEKELYIIKTCVNGEPKFQVMSLEEPEEANAIGLKAAFDNSISKMNFAFERKTKEVGMCSDGAAVNVALYNLVKPTMGEHYLLILCPAHKVELALKDSFKGSSLNDTSQKTCTEVYYFFRRAPLRWKLFKRQGTFLEQEYRKYKRPEGTRWVEHSISSIESFMFNLPVLVAFCNQQILQPHNKTMKDLKPKLQGIKNDVCSLKELLFTSAKIDILTTIRPLSKILQDNSLISPEFITICRMTIDNIDNMIAIFEKRGSDAFLIDDIFPQTNVFLRNLVIDNTEIIPERESRGQQSTGNINYLYHDYLLKGNLEDAKTKTINELCNILRRLQEVFKSRFSVFLEDPVFIAMADFLNTKAYAHNDVDLLFEESVQLIYDRFEMLFQANGCKKEKLKTEFRTLFSHVTTFLKRSTSSKCWPQLFQLRDGLSLSNILHVAELCIVVPLSNAECERVFSFLWRLYCKERMSLSHETLERLLQLRCDNDYSASNYDHAIDLFISQYPDGTVRKRERRIDGHTYTKKKKTTIGSCEKSYENIHRMLFEKIQDINLNAISDDEWTDSDDE